MMQFLCPACRAATGLDGCPVCGRAIPHEGGIYRFCDAPAVALTGHEQYIGYDRIGADFEPMSVLYGYDDDRYGVYDACADMILARFGQDVTVLDLGAGLCTASLPLAKRGLCVIAGDISRNMLEIGAERANGRFSNLMLVQMNAYGIPLADHAVDIVIANAILHLIGDPGKVVREIARVLKPGGCVICYGSFGQAMSEDEAVANRRCNQVIRDIEDKYYRYLFAHGHTDVFLNPERESVLLSSGYFRAPQTVLSQGFTEEFTDKLKFLLHRMKTGAFSDLQDTPRDLIRAAWEQADAYAIAKYGADYGDIKGFSRYGAKIEVYEVASMCN